MAPVSTSMHISTCNTHTRETREDVLTDIVRVVHDVTHLLSREIHL